MTDLIFVGWSHHDAPLDLRERLAFSRERALEALDGLFRERILSEGAIVSTCNRAEIYGLTEHPDGFTALSGFLSRFHAVDREVLQRTARSASGDAMVRHLFHVAAGLDSMALGEAQILGQIREAYKFASEARTTRAVTNRLFMSAVECGRRVRTETGLGQRPTSVAGIALSLANRVFETLAGRRVLLLGAGETVELTARLLVDEGVTDLVFTNRSPEKAAALAERSGGRSVPWESRVAAFADVDIVLSATGAPEPVVKADELKKALGKARRRGPLLILDLAVPRDVEVAAGDLADVYLYDMDAVGELARQNAAERVAEIPKAELVVEDAVRRFLDWYAGLSHVDVLKALRGRFDELRRTELERHAGKLAKLPESERELVNRITEGIVAKILHAPTVGLKEGDPSERLERAAAVRALFKLDGEK